VDYTVRFIGYIDERKRPEGFPHEVYVDAFYRVKDGQELKEAINGQCRVFINQQCMVVPKEPGKLEDMSRVQFDIRMLVPWHMITHLSTITKKIIGEIPEINEAGIPELMDGTKAVIQ
jgi:hypothetical protein